MSSSARLAVVDSLWVDSKLQINPTEFPIEFAVILKMMTRGIRIINFLNEELRIKFCSSFDLVKCQDRVILHFDFYFGGSVFAPPRIDISVSPRIFRPTIKIPKMSSQAITSIAPIDHNR